MPGDNLDAIHKAEMQVLAMDMAKIMSASIAAEIQASERRVTQRMDDLRTDFMKEIGEIKQDQKEIAVAVAKVETRLQEGDKRFESLEKRVAMVEAGERSSAISVAKLIGAAAAGALSVKAIGL